MWVTGGGLLRRRSDGRKAMGYADQRLKGSRGASRKSEGSQQGASNYPAGGWMAKETLSNMSRPSMTLSAESMGGWPPKYACIDVTSATVVQEQQ